MRPPHFSPAREISSVRDPMGLPSVSVGQGAGLSTGSTGLRRRERASRHCIIIPGNHSSVGESRGHKLLANATTCYTNSGQNW